MIYIAVSIFGFIVIHLFALVCMKKIAAGVKPATWIIGNGLLNLCARHAVGQFQYPAPTRMVNLVGLVLLPLSTAIALFPVHALPGAGFPTGRAPALLSIH
ncbi:hypothetical protein ACFLS8_04045 [Chloroflexota bacterium]